MKMKAPKDVTSASWGGESFDVKKGVVDVPHTARADLEELGFVVVEDKEPEKEPEKKPESSEGGEGAQ